MKKPPNGVGKPETRPEQQIFSEAQRDSTAYFFFRLSNIYLAEYVRELPDEESEIAAKRENCKFVGDYTREEISKGCDWIHEQKRNGEDGWRFMDIDRCVGAIKQANTVKACHQISNVAKELPLLKANPESVAGTRQGLKELFA